MVEKLGTSLHLYQEYEQLLGNGQSFQDALGNVYFTTLIFLWKARSVFLTKGPPVKFQEVFRSL